jgi:hypothetical protein
MKRKLNTLLEHKKMKFGHMITTKFNIGDKVEYADAKGTIVAFMIISTSKYFVMELSSFSSRGREAEPYVDKWMDKNGNSLSHVYNKNKKYYYLNFFNEEEIKMVEISFENKRIIDI